jgi:hypothetical protein
LSAINNINNNEFDWPQGWYITYITFGNKTKMPWGGNACQTAQTNKQAKNAGITITKTRKK